MTGDRIDPAAAYLTPQAAARYLGITERTLQAWRQAGTGPEYIRLGGTRFGRLRYSRTALDRWMASQTVGGSPSAGNTEEE